MADVKDMNTTKASDLQAWIPEGGSKKRKGKKKLPKVKKNKKLKVLKNSKKSRKEK